jgi:hypothetical protein
MLQILRRKSLLALLTRFVHTSNLKVIEPLVDTSPSTDWLISLSLPLNLLTPFFPQAIMLSHPCPKNQSMSPLPNSSQSLTPLNSVLVASMTMKAYTRSSKNSSITSMFMMTVPNPPVSTTLASLIITSFLSS